MQTSSPLSLPSTPYCFSQLESWYNLFSIQLSISTKSVGIQFSTSTLPPPAAASPRAAAPRAAPLMGSAPRARPRERPGGWGTAPARRGVASAARGGRADGREDGRTGPGAAAAPRRN